MGAGGRVPGAGAFGSGRVRSVPVVALRRPLPILFRPGLLEPKAHPPLDSRYRRPGGGLRKRDGLPRPAPPGELGARRPDVPSQRRDGRLHPPVLALRGGALTAGATGASLLPERLRPPAHRPRRVLREAGNPLDGLPPLRASGFPPLYDARDSVEEPQPPWQLAGPERLRFPGPLRRVRELAVRGLKSKPLDNTVKRFKV